MSTLSEMSTSAIEREWATDGRWSGVERPYEAADVVRLRGSVRVEYSLARRGSEKLWKSLHTHDYVSASGALGGAQAVEMVRAGCNAIFLSGRQVAADGNLSEQIYPDQSLYAANSVPAVVRRINNALRRADQIDWAESLADGTTHASTNQRDWVVPIVADAEAGFGGALNVFELMKSMIEAGAAGVHFEDQLSSERKCGHMGGKVLIPTGQHVRTLSAARLAADICGVPTLLIARTDALGANLLTTDADPRDQEFLTGERSPEGLYYLHPGIETAVARGLAYAPYADLLWCETSTPDLEQARVFAEGIHEQFPGKLLAYNCPPSSKNWPQHPDGATSAKLQRELAAMGYAFQFVTRAGRPGVDEREVGAGYFDDVASTVSGGLASTLALAGSSAEQRF